MNDSDAIQLIDAVCANYHGTRKDHVALQQAINHIKSRLLPEQTQPVAEDKPVKDTQE